PPPIFFFKNKTAYKRLRRVVSVVNPLTALDYASSGVVIRRFSISVPFTVSLIHPLHRPASALVDAFTAHLQAHLPRLIDPLEAILHPQPKA
ncbi:hypothetical protein D3H39_22640, partial [Citrobacter portucalensis]